MPPRPAPDSRRRQIASRRDALPRWVLGVLAVSWGVWPGEEARAESPPPPAFQIAPLVQRIDTSPGRVVPFSFQVQCFGEPTTVRIQSVNLMQQESGLILPDDSAPAAAGVELSSEERTLRANEMATIRGRIVAPLKGGAFYPLGILVTDLGRPWETGAAPSGTNGARISLQFVTRYLLRLEINVLGFGGEDASRLQVLDGKFVQRDGMPWVSLWVRNPSDWAQAFSIRCRVRAEGSGPAPPSFSLAMPVRASELGERRFEALILGQSRIVMEAPVPEAVFPGRYELDVDVLQHANLRHREKFAVSAAAGQFPRQEAQETMILDAVRVAPAQIEFSLRPQGNRLLPLGFQNTSARAVQIRLTPRALSGGPADWFSVRPNSFTLAPLERRNVLATVRVGNNVNAPRYALLRAEIQPEGSSKSAFQDFPVALAPQGDYPLEFDVGELRYRAHQGRGALVAPLTNRGAIHLAPQASLTVSDTLGRRFQTPGGFGKWVLPGQTSDLEFASPLLPPGLYDVQIEMMPAADAPAQIMKGTFEVGPSGGAISKPKPALREPPMQNE